MASLDQIKNMTWHRGGTMSEQPTEQVKEDDSGDEYDEEECSLRKRKTKKIGKGVCTLKTCERKLSRDYRDKKRVKEARARKRTKRSHTQLKGERDYGVVHEMESEIGFREAREAYEDREERDRHHDQSDPESEHSDILSFCDNCMRGHCVCDEIEESAGFTRGRHGKYVCKETDSAWMERMNSEVLRLTALW